MKLSKETLEILKNFSTINENICIKPGNILTTISVGNNIIAEAVIDESFDKEFCIYNLIEWLNVYNVTDNGDIYIMDKFMDISWGNSKIKYGFADKDSIYYTEKVPKFHHNGGSLPDQVIEVEVASSTIKTASVLKSPHMGIVSNGSNVKLKTFDYNTPSSNSYELDLDVNHDKKFAAILDINSLKILPGTYKVKISSAGITCWTNLDRPVTYYITLDTVSKFE
jgi:hypothetical protein